MLDVPDEARAIAFGILLGGPGQAWMEDLKLEVVGSEVTTTNALPRKPTLSFDAR